MTDLFTHPLAHPRSDLAPGVVLLRGHASAQGARLVERIGNLVEQSPLRHMETPGGRRMGVAMANCGRLGWVSDRHGYRYSPTDPEHGSAWPELPAEFAALARGAATVAGFADFAPDACLINAYVPGARLSLHQDRDERDFAHPIVSVSLGLDATFLLGGDRRSDAVHRLALAHGDVLVWGGPARLRYHGIAPLKEGVHPLTGRLRYNLTFRRAG